MNESQHAIHTKYIVNDNYSDEELAILENVFKESIEGLTPTPANKAIFKVGDCIKHVNLHRVRLTLERFQLGKQTQWHGQFKDGNKQLQHHWGYR